MTERIDIANRPVPQAIALRRSGNVAAVCPPPRSCGQTVGWHLLGAAMAILLAPASAVAVSCEASDGYTRLTGPQLSSVLVGSLACYPATPPYENQEAMSGGKIVDYKKGPKDPIDPSLTVGTYTLTGGANPTITFTYANGPSYIYSVWGTTTEGSGVYDLCAGSSPVTIRVVAGSTGPC